MNKKNMILDHTPMIKQYLSIKSNYCDIFLLYRMGDFYELFYEDAIRISKLLNLTLTKRGYSLGSEVPMAGIPVSSLNYYLKKIIDLRESVAICEQNGIKKSSSGLIDRKVVKVITPGTAVEDFLLEEDKDNLLGSIYYKNKKFGYAILNLCSGSFCISEHLSCESFISEIHRTNPEELLVPENFSNSTVILNRKGIRYKSLREFDFKYACKQLEIQFGFESILNLKEKNLDLAIRASGCLLSYAKSIQCFYLPHIKSISVRCDNDYIYMSDVTRKHLEIFLNVSGKKEHTLLSILDHTSTSMGSRLLKQWLSSPIKDTSVIKNRHAVIKALKTVFFLLKPLLKKIGDLERIISRIYLKTACPRDLILMRVALNQFSKINFILNNTNCSCLKDISYSIKEFNSIKELLERSIKDFPSSTIQEGNVIEDRYNSELDNWRSIKEGTCNYIKSFEIKERNDLNISSLKIRYNKIIGYYIQISKRHFGLVPDHYILRQTLKNFKRYSTQKLIEYEYNIINAREKVLEIEKKLYNEIFDFIFPHLESLQKSSFSLSKLDVLNNLSERACTLNYVCPIIHNKYGILLSNGRHPVVETILRTPFIPNSVHLSKEQNTLIITGPNMGGKSTYMRQIALIVIMAWIGSFVPASYAKIGYFDKIFTRIGSADNVANGKSTFMTEMVEMSYILRNANKYSLILIDEIGRGTSINDGLSLAWACMEFFVKKIKSMTLLSTHYFALTDFKNNFSNVKNVYFDALEYNKKVSFMYSLKEGSYRKSYGLAVAELADFPSSVIEMAKKKFQELSSSE
ncbi:DNA mismatch repair protein MutS [Buchnera aphidicola (Schlechtendalia chinensis)]|uniref:DNA mismatch repair protein MutS n=2 Tax=Buchnera aphidicola TaxID=9 RepID=A0A172WDU0_BUCSC|nr:DNA mismatch repair protein MutS [Buchnera aphidicola (Schlechtendalia chinensis)]